MVGQKNSLPLQPYGFRFYRPGVVGARWRDSDKGLTIRLTWDSRDVPPFPYAYKCDTLGPVDVSRAQQLLLGGNQAQKLGRFLSRGEQGLFPIAFGTLWPAEYDLEWQMPGWTIP